MRIFLSTIAGPVCVCGMCCKAWFIRPAPERRALAAVLDAMQIAGFPLSQTIRGRIQLTALLRPDGAFRNRAASCPRVGNTVHSDSGSYPTDAWHYA